MVWLISLRCSKDESMDHGCADVSSSYSLGLSFVAPHSLWGIAYLGLGPCLGWAPGGHTPCPSPRSGPDYTVVSGLGLP
jgi:hypothetical protein